MNYINKDYVKTVQVNKCQFGPKPRRQTESSLYKETERKVVLKFAKKIMNCNRSRV